MIVKPGEWNREEGELNCCVGMKYEYNLNCFFRAMDLTILDKINILAINNKGNLWAEKLTYEELVIYKSVVEMLRRK